MVGLRRRHAHHLGLHHLLRVLVDGDFLQLGERSIHCSQVSFRQPVP